MLATIKKNLIPIAVVVIGLGVLYYFYTSGTSSTLLSTEPEPSPVSQEILNKLGSLRVIKLNAAIFSDPLFLSLSDFGVTIPPAAAGRRNPFAPVGQGGTLTTTPAATTSATTASTTPPKAPATPAH